MKQCSKCHTEVDDNVKYCPSCGNSMEEKTADKVTKNAEEIFKNFNNTADTTGGYEKNDIDQNKGISILSYIGILVIVPILAAKESKFARYHANQGLVLVICEVGWGIILSFVESILYRISWFLGSMMGGIMSLGSLVFLVLSIMGIINVINGRTKELPFIGQFKILK